MTTPLTYSTTSFSETLSSQLIAHSKQLNQDEVTLYWLGQAGFIIESKNFRLFIDPYLSNSLELKYKGTAFPHTRMMGSPITPSEIDRLDYVLCTHRHTDHMDPETLTPLAMQFPSLSFVVPAYSINEALSRCHVTKERLLAVNAGDAIHLLENVTVYPIPSAHETLDTNEQGEHQWLGYILQIGKIKIYHSGDCIPYEGLTDLIREHKVDIALLPVNGRDRTRSSQGVPGNFTLDEAITMAQEAGIKVMFAHHYGLFDFNTVSAQSIDEQAANLNTKTFQIVRAQLQRAWHFKIS